jgi:phosphohistidine phosphatase SixA
MRPLTTVLVAALALACLPLALAGPRVHAPLQDPAPSAGRAQPAAPPDGARAEPAQPLAAPRTVILLRHAEKEAAPADPRDPSLSAAGAARAQELARLLGACGAGHLFASELKRTSETLAPLSRDLSVPVETVPAGKPKDLLARLDALPPGSVAIVCGHSNTVPQVAQLLGVELSALVKAQGIPMLADDAYDRIFLVTRPVTGPASVVELGYGARAGSTPSSGR